MSNTEWRCGNCDTINQNGNGKCFVCGKIEVDADAKSLDKKSMTELLYLQQLVEEAIQRKPTKLKDRTYYVVEVANRATNPIHACIYYHQCDGAYGNMLFNHSYEDSEAQNIQLSDLHYFKVIREIDISIPHNFKLPRDIIN